VVEDPDDLKTMEARRSLRVRTFLQARVSYGDGAMTTACTVNQLSDVGARLNISGACSLPETFEVAIPQRNIARRARLVWRKDDQAGVDFIDNEEDRRTPTADPAGRIKELEAENAKLKTQIGLLMQQIGRLTEE
jgi:PilZ domain